MLHSSAKGLPVSLAASGAFSTARRSLGPQGLRRLGAPPGFFSSFMYSLFLFPLLSPSNAPLEARFPVWCTDGCIARAWWAVTNPFRFFFAVPLYACPCMPASSHWTPAPLASLFLLLMIPSPCLSSYFIKEHGGYKRGDTRGEGGGEGAGTCTPAWTKAQMDLVDRYVTVCAQDVSQRPLAHRGQRVRRPPAAGLNAGSSTVPVGAPDSRCG